MFSIYGNGERNGCWQWQSEYSVSLRTLSPLELNSNLKAFSTGLALRFALHTNPDAKGTYIAEYLFVVLSVCYHKCSIVVFTHIGISHAPLSQRIMFYSVDLQIILILQSIWSYPRAASRPYLFLPISRLSSYKYVHQYRSITSLPTSLLGCRWICLNSSEWSENE